MSSLVNSRRAIRHLLDERSPVDAIANYYAFYHPDHKTQLLTSPTDSTRADGYIALSRTGMDLFRPLVTLRLPLTDMDASVELIYQTMMPGTAVIFLTPPAYIPLLQAVCDIQTEEYFRIFTLDRSRFDPIINVLVTQTTAPNGLHRFIIQQSSSPDQEIVASASLNWQSPQFAEIAVTTNPSHQRQGWGRSVLAAMVQHLLGNGRTPLYVASENNTPSIELARRVGFKASGAYQVMLQAILKPHP